jgi:hypothetical protein
VATSTMVAALVTVPPALAGMVVILLQVAT